MGLLKKLKDEETLRYYQGNYRFYCILGRAASEKDKLQYYNTWMKCYDILDKFLADCETRLVQSEQVFCRLKPGKSGRRLQTAFSKADTGGLLPWVRESHQDICLKYLEAALGVIEEAEEKGLPLREWVEAGYPKRDSYTAFVKHEALARMKEGDTPDDHGYYDFVFRLSHSSDVIRGLPANQEVSVFISERYAGTKDGAEIDKLIRDIMRLARAVKVGVTRIPLCRIEYSLNKQPDAKIVIPFIWNDYGDHKNLSFKPNPSGAEWAVMDLGN